MIVTNIAFNPERDIKQVSPDGWLDLRKALKYGVVPGDLDYHEIESNGFTEPEQVGSSVTDPFAAARAAAEARSKVGKKAPAGDTGDAGDTE